MLHDVSCTVGHSLLVSVMYRADLKFRDAGRLEKVKQKVIQLFWSITRDPVSCILDLMIPPHSILHIPT